MRGSNFCCQQQQQQHKNRAHTQNCLNIDRNFQQLWLSMHSWKHCVCGAGVREKCLAAFKHTDTHVVISFPLNLLECAESCRCLLKVARCFHENLEKRNIRLDAAASKPLKSYQKGHPIFREKSTLLANFSHPPHKRRNSWKLQWTVNDDIAWATLNHETAAKFPSTSARELNSAQ